MVDAGDITQRVVLIDAPAAVQILLSQQAVQYVPLEAVAFVVFITQVQQAVIGVVAELDGMAEGVNPLGRVCVGGELAGDLSTVYFLRINLSYLVHCLYLSGSA